MSETVGLREIRQQASELVRRVEDGEEFVVTVAGRPAARLVPLRRQRWRTGHEIAHIFTAPADLTWPGEHANRSDAFDDSPSDPWARKT